MDAIGPAIIILGPPGSGKSLQADLLGETLGLIHFDSGRYLEKLLHENRLKQKIKEEFKKGLLVDPRWFLGLVKREIRKIRKAGFGLVLAGSFRTSFEAFGDKKTPGLLDLLTKLYGKENIFIFRLNVLPSVSLKRNRERLVCESCHLAPINPKRMKICPRCGGKLIKRQIDDPRIIKARLDEYKERSEPVVEEFRKRGLAVIEIDGEMKPIEVFRSIFKSLNI
ncbi:MAG: nucleoside monophosphate kinase [Candidatus Colwellbacteria bacterium]|nr:nucleoside monophosphate kinase [Candidatus Colwellbacteria bacterium]